MPTTRPTMMEQLSSLSEEAIERLAHSPLTARAMEAGMQVKGRVEKLVASLADLDGRVSGIEKRLDALEKKAKQGTATTRARKPRSTTARKPPVAPEAPVAPAEPPPPASDL
jgi:hypothetical protein